MIHKIMISDLFLDVAPTFCVHSADSRQTGSEQARTSFQLLVKHPTRQVGFDQ